MGTANYWSSERVAPFAFPVRNAGRTRNDFFRYETGVLFVIPFCEQLWVFGRKGVRV